MSLVLNSDARFFIAIAKQKAHSFLMLGTHKNYQVEHLLCRVGKIFDLEETGFPAVFSAFAAVFAAVHSHAKAKIQDEGLSRPRYGHVPISYQAYELTYEHYLEFARTLEALQTTSNQFEFYKPVHRKNNQVTFERTRQAVFPGKKNSTDLIESVNTISTNNTCRHGAISLIEEVLKTPVSSSVSSAFYAELSYHSYLDFGVPSQDVPFYVLPVPPGDNLQLNPEKRIVVEKLYQRMEHLLTLEPNSIHTKNKFECLKELYNQSIGTQKECSLDELIHTIQTWKQQNWTILNRLRKTYFWDFFISRKSATVSVIEEIEEELKPQSVDDSCIPW